MAAMVVDLQQVPVVEMKEKVPFLSQHKVLVGGEITLVVTYRIVKEPWYCLLCLNDAQTGTIVELTTRPLAHNSWKSRVIIMIVGLFAEHTDAETFSKLWLAKPVNGRAIGSTSGKGLVLAQDKELSVWINSAPLKKSILAETATKT